MTVIESYNRRFIRVRCDKSWCHHGTRWVPAGTDVDAELVALGWQVRTNSLGIVEYRCRRHHRPEKKD